MYVRIGKHINRYRYITIKVVPYTFLSCSVKTPEFNIEQNAQRCRGGISRIRDRHIRNRYRNCKRTVGTPKPGSPQNRLFTTGLNFIKRSGIYILQLKIVNFEIFWTYRYLRFVRKFLWYSLLIPIMLLME